RQADLGFDSQLSCECPRVLQADVGHRGGRNAAAFAHVGRHLLAGPSGSVGPCSGSVFLTRGAPCRPWRRGDATLTGVVALIWIRPRRIDKALRGTRGVWNAKCGLGGTGSPSGDPNSILF